jgi:hypothetical protein
LQRVLSTVTLLGLLVATAGAFAITEHLKLIKSPISGINITNAVLAPTCHCATSDATIRLKLRHPDRVTVTIVDSAGRTVATLPSIRLPAHQRHVFAWDGRTQDEAVAPDGVYHPWVHLEHARRTFRFTNKITLDTKPPQVLSARAAKPLLLAAPGRTVAIRYAFDEHAHALVYLGRRRIILGRVQQPRGKVKWAGTRGGRPLRAGRYVLSVGAQDLAGNVTPAGGRRQVTVEVRYIVLSPGVLQVRSGRRFTVHVKTAAKRYTWHLGHRHGARRGRTLRLRAPTTPGRYRLVVVENGHAVTAVVRVRAK